MIKTTINFANHKTIAMNIKNAALLFALITFIGLGTAQAQKQKFGHINTAELLEMMPERDSAEKKLQDFAKQLELQYGSMSNEYEKKVTEYQKNVATYNELIKASKEEEIVDLERRIQNFQTKAQESLAKKESQLMEPIIEKAKNAIDAVSKENGYTYVFDTSIGALLHSPEGDDMLPLVKAKLNL